MTVRPTLLSKTLLGMALAAFVAAPALAEDLVFALNNTTGQAVTEFYASPSNVGNWEEDILGTDVLDSGQSVEITIADGRTQCTYDFRTVFADGQVITEPVDICALGSYTLHD